MPAQTPIPRKDTIIDGMVGSSIFSTIDLKDGFYQILMDEGSTALTAVSTPSGMLYEWLVMPQGLKNAPATFNRVVSMLLRPLRAFAPSYFDDVYIHSRADPQRGKTACDVHLEHLRAVFDVMRANELYGSLAKCLFCQDEIPVLGCFVGVNGVRADPEKISAIADWPTPNNVTEIRQWLGLATYLHKFSRNFADLIRPLSQLLKKSTPWEWTPECQSAFDATKRSLTEAPILVLPDPNRLFHVVCDASQFAIGAALMQHDEAGTERVIAYISRQLKPAERNYPVHDKELLAMKYALVKFSVHLLGEPRFVMYTDHASLRTAVKSPHLSQRMSRWLSYFAQFNFVVLYKPGKLNIVADALSRRPDYENFANDSSVFALDTSPECISAVSIAAVNPIFDQIRLAYAADDQCLPILLHLQDKLSNPISTLSRSQRAQLCRFSLADGLLYFSVDPFDQPRVVVPLDSDIRFALLHEYHDCAASGHFAREKTYGALSRDFWWRHMYRWVRTWVRTCDACQRAKSSPSSQAPLSPLPIPTDVWRSVSMDFLFGLPPDKLGRTGIVAFVCRLSKMVRLAAVRATVTARDSADIFMHAVFRHHGLPTSIVSDRDVRFTSHFWRALFARLGTKLDMSTASHPETDGQTERTNRVILGILRTYASSHSNWSQDLPLVEFAINNSVHSSTGLTPFYVNHLRHPRLPVHLFGVPTLGGGEASHQPPPAGKRGKRSRLPHPDAPLSNVHNEFDTDSDSDDDEISSEMPADQEDEFFDCYDDVTSINADNLPPLSSGKCLLSALPFWVH